MCPLFPPPKPAPMPAPSGTTATRWASSAPPKPARSLVDRSHRGVLTLTGADRQTWLHSISTQHVSELPDGASTQNLSLDGQGRVEDHWMQTELGGVSYLDTEPWRGDPLLDYLRKMVFWSEVTAEPADLAVLSLLGPQLGERAVLDALGLDALPAETTATPIAGGGFARRMAEALSGQIELDVLVSRDDVAGLQNRLTQAGVRPAGRLGVRSPPGRRGPRAARRRHRRAHHPARSGLDRRPRRWRCPPRQGLLPRSGDRRAGA